MAKNEERGSADEVRQFARFLMLIDDGELHEETSRVLKEANSELARRADQDGKARGRITLTMEITHERGGIVVVVGDCVSKLPRPKPAKSVFWRAPTGGYLSAKNPKQLDLPIREVPQAPREAAIEIEQPKTVAKEA